MASLDPTPGSSRTILVVENFYQDPAAIRAYALAQDYYLPYQNDADVAAGRTRPTWWAQRFKSAAECPFKSSGLLQKTLERLTGDQIDRLRWNLPYPIKFDGKPDVQRAKQQPVSALWNCCFHAKPQTGQTLGQGVHVHTDADDWNAAGDNGWAGIIYLNPDAPRDGGLHLWEERMPGTKRSWMGVPDDWTHIDSLGNVHNRLILCRGRLAHSGADGWGDSLETARVFQTFFFRVL